MSRSLYGIRVAHFEARRAVELDGLISRHGGVPRSAPALSEVPIAPTEKENAALEALASGAFDIVVLLTGVGTRRLFEEAERISRLDQVVTSLRRAVIVSRGPKPLPILREHRLKAAWVAPEPHTTTELIAVLDRLTVIDRSVLVVTAGEPFTEASASLRIRGANVVELRLYEWALSPTNVAQIAETIDEIITGSIGAVLFTTQIQVRHVFEVAEQRGSRDALLSALRERVLVGAVGPTVEQALTERGLHADIVPQHPKMGHLVVALADRVRSEQKHDTDDVFDYVQAVLGGRGNP